MSSEDLKLRIKETPISHIIGQYLPLTKRGTSILAVCPFHDDKNPSMHVNDHRNMFKCFVDNIGGDAISFVQRYKNVDFVDAMKDICDRMGWDYNEFVQEKKQSPKYELGKKILTKSAQLYRKIAKTEKFDSYNSFIKNRKISETGASDYMLGFAPADNALSNYLESIKDESERNKALNLALELGLIRKNTYKNEGHYDTFRERIMFPIWDQFGQVIGFTGRATTDKQKAKYYNSMDSFLFNKSHLLYGLHFAKSHIRQRNQIILVEGNMDQFTLAFNGFENSVAIMGTAVSDYSLKILKALSTNFYFALDNDDAGHKAMARTNEQCLQMGIVPYYVDLNPHKDPDEFIMHEGTLALKERIDNASTYLEYQLAQALPESIPQNLDRKLDILQNIYQILSPLGESVRANEHIAEYAKKLGLKSDPTQLNKNYVEFLKESKKSPLAPKAQAPEINHMDSIPVPENFSNQSSVELKPIKQKFGRAEKFLLQTLIQHPESLAAEEMGEILDFVTHTEVKDYILRLKDLIYEIDETEYTNFISSELENDDLSLDLKEAIGSAVFKFQPQDLDDKTLKRLLKDVRIRVQKEKLLSEKESLKEKYRECVEEAEANKIIYSLNEIDKQLIQLK